MNGPPAELVARLTADGVLSGVEWHPQVGSTNVVAGHAAARGAAEIRAIVADEQTAGRGRQGRAWAAPPGTSLLHSLLVRPSVAAPALGLLPLLAGLALAEAVDGLLAGPAVALKWPNDLLVEGRKAAGILVEGLAGGAYAVGIGVNVDWRGVERPAALSASATSLAEAAESFRPARPGDSGQRPGGCAADVDRWALFAALAEAFAGRYRAWQAEPRAFLDGYRARCATLGAQVTATRGLEAVQGLATGIADDGALELRTPAGERLRLLAGDVTHVRGVVRRS